MTAQLPDLHGKRALVTGAASGIGLATGRLLAASGATVCLSDRPGDALDAAAADIAGSLAQPADLTSVSEIEALLTACGAVDILVNNAGLQHVSPLEDFPPEKWDTLLAVMLTAPF
ncbi:MAG: 3-hydroxybutyrate dehydrogenase, partial [Gaiellaceae bacterium]|nr:3-hydroxybutyrate dehydrogenase [Gaiellaceae bacterium]